MQRRFAYAIDPKSVKFSPTLAAATILNPAFFALLPSDLFTEGKKDIERWFLRVPDTEEFVPNPTAKSNPFGRLLAKQSSIKARPAFTFNR